MQVKRVISNSAICQQRFSDLNIKWILNKRNKKDIKWCFRLYNIFYKVWEFFEIFRLFFKESSSSLLLEYYILKFEWKNWLLNQNSIFWIWVDLLIWDFVQSLQKWSDSPHFQHSSEYVGTVTQQSLWWEGSCQIGFNDLAT